jgi:DNA-binding NarL/FixJ family response regulator
MVREGLRAMLADAAIDIVAEAGSAAEAIRLAAEATPDVVLLDMELPDLDGVTALARIKQVRPQAAVLVVTMHDDPRLVRAAVQAGTAGYVLKGIGRQELLAAVRAVRDGDAVLEPGLLRAIVAETPAGPPPARAAGAEDALTPIERDVLRCIAGGLTNRQIAGRMRWSVATAKKYVQRVLAKLEVSDRTQAAVVAVRRGLLE